MFSTLRLRRHLGHVHGGETCHVPYPPFFFLYVCQDCWTHVNAKKGFLPKLWALLKEGGAGMARALHPNLMPLLSKLPLEVTDPPLDFNTCFFTSLIQG